MKINVCICDDDVKINELLQTYFDNYIFISEYEYNITYCRTEEDIVEFYERDNTAFDLIFMDIELGSMSNGIDVSKRIRANYDSNVYIVILTSYPEYMREGFEIHAYQYLYKPLEYSVFKCLMSEFIKSFNDKHITVALLDWENTKTMIKLNEITYIEVTKKFTSKNYLVFHTNHHGNKNIFHDSSSLTEWEERLKDKYFVSPFRGLLVNLGFVRGFNGTVLELTDGTMLPVSRRKFIEMKKALSSYLFTVKSF